MLLIAAKHGWKMSASRLCKDHGLNSLAQVASLTGVDAGTLGRWYHNRPELFNIIVKGCQSVVCGPVKAEKIKNHAKEIIKETGHG